MAEKGWIPFDTCWSDLTDEDFADRVHLTHSGRQKMASDVAQEVRAMAFQLGYVPKALAERYP